MSTRKLNNQAMHAVIPMIRGNMDFYTALSTYYDEIFAVSQSDLDFINSLIPSNGRVLDVGCGTGNKTVLLKHAPSVTAIDLDSGMIEYARKHHALPHIHYRQMDMRHIAEPFEKASFDAVLCLGNTLVHLSENKLGPFLHDVKGLLRSGGSSVIQILNYDRILDKNISQLPVIETEHTTFTRRYHWVNDTMHFQTAITLKATGERVENDIVLYPLRTKALAVLLRTAGFRELRWYGSFSGGPLGEDSFVSIVQCSAVRSDQPGRHYGPLAGNCGIRGKAPHARAHCGRCSGLS